MSNPPGEEAIRDLAYALWEGDGRRDGRADEYWLAAQRQLSQPTPTEPADPHPADEDSENVHNRNPGGASVVEGRDGGLMADPDQPGSPA